MIIASSYVLSAGQMLGPLYPSGRELRVMATTTGIARLYASASPPSLIAADTADGAITPATLAARTVPRSNWAEIGLSGSKLLEGWADGYSAITVVAEGADARIDVAEWELADARRMTSGQSVKVSLSTQPIDEWSAGVMMTLPVAELPVDSVQFGAPSASVVTRQLLDGSAVSAKGAQTYGEASMTVPDTAGAHADAIALATFADAEFLLRLDRTEPSGFVTDSTLVAIKITSKGGADTIIDGVRAYAISAIITRQPMRIYNGA